jgi:hypothetical protein
MKQSINPKWGRREQWTLIELAYLVAGAEPYQSAPPTDNPHEAFGRIEDAELREVAREVYEQSKDAIKLGNLARSETTRTGLIGNTRVKPSNGIRWARSRGWDVSHINEVVDQFGSTEAASSPQSVVRDLAWIANAADIGRRLRPKHKNLNLERLAEKVLGEMKLRRDAGESGMTGRGGRLPTAATIKRRALKGI